MIYRAKNKLEKRPTSKKLIVSLMFAIIMILSVPTHISSTQAQSNAVLPGGATSLNEAHGDWTVSCGPNRSKNVVCAMSQQLFNPENKQRVMAIELTLNGQSSLNGAMVLPFGIKLSEGVKLSVDESKEQIQVPYSTCLPVGCIAPLIIDKKVIETFRAGSVVSVILMTNDGTSLQIELSLSGFVSAHNRIITLKS